MYKKPAIIGSKRVGKRQTLQAEKLSEWSVRC